MTRSGDIWRQWAIKVIFPLVGLSLFVVQVSDRFYRSASMPVVWGRSGQHNALGYRHISGTNTVATLSLDKRFDVKPSVALLTPVFRFLSCAGPVTFLPCFFAPKPVGNKPVLTPLRGPPRVRAIFS